MCFWAFNTFTILMKKVVVSIASYSKWLQFIFSSQNWVQHWHKKCYGFEFVVAMVFSLLFMLFPMSICHWKTEPTLVVSLSSRKYLGKWAYISSLFPSSFFLSPMLLLNQKLFFAPCTFEHLILLLYSWEKFLFLLLPIVNDYPIYLFFLKLGSTLTHKKFYGFEFVVASLR